MDDLRFALRMLRKSPAATAVAVLTLAVALGATTAIFSALSAMLLRPLPFPRPDQLVALQDIEPTPAGETEHGLSWPEFTDLRAQAPDLAGLAAYRQIPLNLTGRGEPEVVDSLQVSEGYFTLLGVQPVAGRLFAAEEHLPNGPAVAIASESFWHRALGGVEPGAMVTLDGAEYQLIGVAPASAAAATPVDLFVPLEHRLTWTDRGTHWLETIGRLKPGVSLQRAQQDLKAAAPRIAQAAKATHLASMHGLREFLKGDAAPLLWLLLAAVGLVLLIAAVNLANVVLARATSRLREFAVRRALGASGLRLARQLLIENAVVGIAGGALGVVLAMWGRDLILRAWPPSLPKLGEAPLDARVLSFAFLLSLCTGLGIGLIPAWQAARGDLQAGLKEGAGATGRGRARGALVVTQSGLAVLLLVFAGLLLSSFHQLLSVSPGFQPEHAVSLRVALPKGRYADKAQRALFFRDLLARISTLPQVKAAGAAWRVPLGGGSSDGNFGVEGHPEYDQEGHEPYAEKRVVTGGYFKAMGIPLLRGRAFDDDDREPEVVINQALARRIFGGLDPVGRRISNGSFSPAAALRVVGVAGDVKQHKLNEEPAMEMYLLAAQNDPTELDIVVRGDGDENALIAAARAQVLAIDPQLPVTKVRTLAQVIERNAGPQRLAAELISAFAAAALLLAALGIYGVVSYAVSRREREIGVRMALGAQAQDVLGMVVREGLRLSLFGVACGIAAALALGRLLAGFLYHVSTTDPATYLLVAFLLALVAALASLLPARRATRVDPAVALRAE